MNFRMFSSSIFFFLIFPISTILPLTTSFAIEQPPAPPREFRAVWVATVLNLDWPSQKGLSTQQQLTEMRAILDKCVEMKMNAVVFQVRGECDAFYKSKYEPWSRYLTGTYGKAPDPYYDPLDMWVAESHDRGLELHVWFNPYRAKTPSTKTLPANHVSKTHPDLVREFGGYMWLDPSMEETRNYSLNVILDVVKRYDIDGIHIDDYFYPYSSYYKGSGLTSFPDDKSWKAYQNKGGTMNRGDWRRDGVNKFVERYYKETKKLKPWVKVGISPFGIWRPGNPAGVKGMDAYSSLYADSKKWLVEGWADYYTPQIYWTINSKGQPYGKLLDWWTNQNPHNRHIWPGNAVSSIGKKGFPASEIIDQIKIGRSIPGASGNIFFRMAFFMQNKGGICDLIAQEVYQNPALVPASPWLASVKPDKPAFSVSKGDKAGESVVTWSAAKGADVLNYVYYFHQGGQWFMKIYPAPEGRGYRMVLSGASKPDMIAVSSIDRFGTESDRVLAKLSK